MMKFTIHRWNGVVPQGMGGENSEIKRIHRIDVSDFIVVCYNV